VLFRSLARFKERWGAEKHEMVYFRYPAQAHSPELKANLLTKLPVPILMTAGRLFYRHFA
jgi:hypothetical protein